MVQRYTNRDYLRVEYPLPLPKYQNRCFTIHNFFRAGLDLTLTAEGRLTREVSRKEGRKKIIYGVVDELYHGELLFYTAQGRKLIKFVAHFWEGQLTKIEDTTNYDQI